MSRFALLGGGVRLRVGVRGKKKDQKEIKGTTKPLMTILDVTNVTAGYVYLRTRSVDGREYHLEKGHQTHCISATCNCT